MEELYNLKKQRFLVRQKKLIEEYNKLYLKLIANSSNYMDLYEIAINNSELLEDFKNLCENNEEVIFMIRLMSAVMYVQDPTNAEKVQKILDDIELNKGDGYTLIKK